MSITKQLKMSETRLGRVELHLIGLLRDGHVKFHLAGIKREFLNTAVRVN